MSILTSRVRNRSFAKDKPEGVYTLPLGRTIGRPFQRQSPEDLD